MTLSEELQWRGFVNQTTFTDITELDTNPRTFYWRVDPSAESMQIGDLAHAGQQALGTQFLTTMAAAVMSAQHPVHLVEKAQAKLVQIAVYGAVYFQVGQLSDVVVVMMEGLGVHTQDPL